MSFLYRKKTKNCKHDWMKAEPRNKSVGYEYFNCTKCGKPRKSKKASYKKDVAEHEYFSRGFL